MAISREEFKRRYAAIREQMEKENLDCILIAGLPDDFNRGNIRYVTGSGGGGVCIFPLEGGEAVSFHWKETRSFPLYPCRRLRPNSRNLWLLLSYSN